MSKNRSTLCLLLLMVWVGLYAKKAFGEDYPSGAQRVVALGGSVTEIIYALAGESKLVGVDASSIYPDAARAQPQLGHFRQVSSEGVLSLNPDLVLAIEDAGPPTSITQLRAAGVEVVIVPSTPSIEGARQKIRVVAGALGMEEAGERLVQRLNTGIEAIERKVGGVTENPRVMFIYARGNGTPNVSGKGTSADAMIRLAGGENAIQAFDGYRPLTAEAVVAAAPDVILVLERGLEALNGKESFLNMPGVALTPAGRTGKIVSMDDMLMLGFGPRLGRAIQDLHAKLFPGTE